MKRESTRTLTIYDREPREPLADGDYPAELVRVEEEQSIFPDKEGELPWQYKFVWYLLDENGQRSDDWISGWATQAWGDRAKYPDWYEAHTGQRPEAGDVVVDDCVGHNVMLTIRTYIKKKGERAGEAANKVTEVRPYVPPRTAPRRAAPAPQPAAPADAEGDPWEEPPSSEN